MTEWDFLNRWMDKLTGPQFGNRVLLIVILALVVLTFMQHSKHIPWKPWSSFFGWIGRQSNGPVIKKQEELQKEIQLVSEDLDKRDSSLREEITKLSNKTDENQRQNEERRLEDKARADRNRILRFADEIRKHDRHSQEMFEQTLADISEYEDFCTEHPKFPNDRATASIQIIRDTYATCLKENDFE